MNKMCPIEIAFLVTVPTTAKRVIVVPFTRAGLTDYLATGARPLRVVRATPRALWHVRQVLLSM